MTNDNCTCPNPSLHLVLAQMDGREAINPEMCLPTAETFFQKALEGVESESIRDWATSDHNRPIWLKIAQNAIDNGKFDTNLFAAYIVAQAIGL